MSSNKRDFTMGGREKHGSEPGFNFTLGDYILL
ncbi:MAG: hypothetical protein Hyperionvirus3_132 [Hyperionvirus sp.]|uniref:Uncharacterized protein n=1 Tax=Hyperionvirus sp. TaxID=2487770 RepID=A0A3G5A6V5_9VIRU|nr:MAG: hypothetical protein Hyperionvirus3_132 [Hyperionvirus sp.]